MAKKGNTPKVLGLDISTKTIGWALFDIQSKELLELTHFSPKVKPQPESKIEEMILKVNQFKNKLLDYKKIGVTKVIIEEPLISSNNIRTVATLIRYNSFITRIIYEVLDIIPEFISTYNSCPLTRKGMPRHLTSAFDGIIIISSFDPTPPCPN